MFRFVLNTQGCDFNEYLDKALPHISSIQSTLVPTLHSRPLVGCQVYESASVRTIAYFNQQKPSAPLFKGNYYAHTHFYFPCYGQIGKPR
jgi:hypothetical protein